MQSNRHILGNTMTAARHPRKLRIVLTPRPAALALVGALAGLILGAPGVPVVAAAPEYVVVDRHSGLAIGGYDPVAYFTDDAALVGRGTFELNHAGVVWRFRNDGNRAAFEAHPEIYMPRFGGYDPVAVAGGVGVDGNPLFWLIAGERLYLFYTEESRATFAADEQGLATTADRKWPAVQLTLP
jgi:hypothetical protein